MRSPKLLVQSLAVAACTALVFTGGTAAMASCIGATPTASATPAAATTSTAPCVGAKAFKSVTYSVNGSNYSILAGKVKAGATVKATFELAAGCDNTAVGIAAYQAVSDHGNKQPFNLQTLSTYEDGNFSTGAKHSVSVVVPNCYYQVDFYTGTVAQPGDYYSPSGRLVDSAVGGTKACTTGSGSGSTTTTVPSSGGGSTTSTTTPGSGSSTTTSTTEAGTSLTTSTTTPTTGGTTNTTRPGDSTTTVPGSGGTTTTQPGDTTVTVGGSTTTSTTVASGGNGSTTTSTTSPDVSGTGATTSTTTHSNTGGTGTTPVCSTSLSGRVTGYYVTVNGAQSSKLSSVKPGDTVAVHFTVAQGCKEQLSLASYSATSLDTTPSGVLSQTLFDSSTGWFMPGDYNLSVKIPNCMYQVDFVEGAVITHFGPVGTNNYYAGRILDTSVGGTTSCNSGSESTTTTTAPNVGGESVTTTTLRPGETTSTTQPGDVAAEQTSNSGTSDDATTSTTSGDVAAENVAAAQLAMTGIDMAPVLSLGMILLGIGGLCLSTGRRLYNRAH